MKIAIVGSEPSDVRRQVGDPRFKQACMTIGAKLHNASHELILCSPFDGSADYFAFRGAIDAGQDDGLSIHFHYPDHPSVLEALARLPEASIRRHSHPPPRSEGQEPTREEWRNSWLLAQLSALDDCDVVVAIGGRTTGVAAAPVLLDLARQRRTPILPFRFLGGAAENLFEAVRYQLQTQLGDDALHLLSVNVGTQSVVQLVESFSSEGRVDRIGKAVANPTFFISYARESEASADLVETLIRRYDHTVLRDESEFGAGHEIDEQIRESIARADVFVALWDREYCCSVWCFDEMQQALDQREAGRTSLWVFCLDDTPVVPPRARKLLYREARDRSALANAVAEELRSLEAR